MYFNHSLTAHLEDNQLLFEYQFGFRKKRSTTLAILDFVNKISDMIDDGGTSIGVFLDLSKAFDTVSHDSYLNNQKQCVCIDGVNSDILPLHYGVPQGSVLGPILFLIYINDSHFATSVIHLVLYADDMNLLASNKCLKKSVSDLNEALVSLQDWFQANKLTVNLTKTKFVIFGSKQRLKNTLSNNSEENVTITLGSKLERVFHAKFLGLILDENLSWNFQINLICRKIAKSIGILYRARHFLNLETLINLYYSFIYSHISYGALIWGSNYKTKLLPIHILQKRAIRAITFSTRRTPSKPLFKKLNFLNIFEIVKLQLTELAYKHHSNQLPETFANYFRDINSIHNYETRSKTHKNYFLPRENLNYGQFGAKYAAVKVWNETPPEIKNSSSIKVFKKKFKDFLLSQ